MMESYNHEGIIIHVYCRYCLCIFGRLIALCGFFPDAPLTVTNLMRALGPVVKWKAFCNSLHIEVEEGLSFTYGDKQDTMKYFLDNSHCQASWKSVALQLYHHMEERALDNLFNFMKSPRGQLMVYIYMSSVTLARACAAKGYCSRSVGWSATDCMG